MFTSADLPSPPQTATSARLQPAHTASLRRLSTLYRWAEGAWALAVYDSDTTRREIQAQLKDVLSPLPLLDVSLRTNALDPLAALQTLAHPHPAPVVSFHPLGVQLPALCMRLDTAREALAGMPHRLLFWIPQHEQQALVERAPNFYSRLSGVFYFTDKI